MTATLETRLETLTRRISEAEAAVGEGAQADLSGLEESVGALCDEARSLPAGRGEELRPALDSLLAAIDRLEHTMRAQLETLKDGLRDHGKRTQATRAYGKSTAGEGRED